MLLHRGRERLVRQRTGRVNALRGHLAEFGIVVPQGLRNVSKLTAIVRDEIDARLPAWPSGYAGTGRADRELDTSRATW